MNQINWSATKSLPPKSYTCGYCGKTVGPNQGFCEDASSPHSDHFIYICSYCNRPTFFFYGEQTPGAPFGNEVASLPVDVENLYQEARRCVIVGAYTAAVLVCRKILMNVAVNKGAGQGEQFIKYVEYLDSKGYIPPDGKKWVDHIRQKGNEANHEIKRMFQLEAQDLIIFTEMLLRFVYEFPSKVR